MHVSDQWKMISAGDGGEEKDVVKALPEAQREDKEEKQACGVLEDVAQQFAPAGVSRDARYGVFFPTGQR